MRVIAHSRKTIVSSFINIFGGHFVVKMQLLADEKKTQTAQRYPYSAHSFHPGKSFALKCLYHFAVYRAHDSLAKAITLFQNLRAYPYL
jgi:hypothetical protein